MTRSDFRKSSALAVIVLAAVTAGAQAQQAMNDGDILTGQLNAMRSRAAKGKNANVFQLVSQPRRLPPPNGLCNLDTGPETFQLITSSDAQAAQLKRLVGKQISVKIGEIACAQDAGQMSEAVVTKWSLVTTR